MHSCWWSLALCKLVTWPITAAYNVCSNMYARIYGDAFMSIEQLDTVGMERLPVYQLGLGDAARAALRWLLGADHRAGLKYRHDMHMQPGLFYLGVLGSGRRLLYAEPIQLCDKQTMPTDSPRGPSAIGLINCRLDVTQLLNAALPSLKLDVRSLLKLHALVNNLTAAQLLRCVDVGDVQLEVLDLRSLSETGFKNNDIVVMNG